MWIITITGTVHRMNPLLSVQQRYPEKRFGLPSINRSSPSWLAGLLGSSPRKPTICSWWRIGCRINYGKDSWRPKIIDLSARNNITRNSNGVKRLLPCASVQAGGPCLSVRTAPFPQRSNSSFTFPLATCGNTFSFSKARWKSRLDLSSAGRVIIIVGRYNCQMQWRCSGKIQ